MKLLHGLFVAIALASGAPTHADGGGSFYTNGVALPMSTAYAYAGRDLFDESKPAVVIVMRDQPIDAAGYDAAPDREKAFKDLLGNFKTKGSTLKLVIGTDKDGHTRVEGADMSYHGAHGFNLGSVAPSESFHTLDLKVNDGKRIEGTLRTTQESAKTDANGTYFDLHFALNVVSGPAFGPGLPPDGGEPFKAYQIYADAVDSAAFRPEDDRMHTLANTLSDAQLRVINELTHKTKPAEWEEKMKAVLRAMSSAIPAAYEFAGGRLKGDVATMDIRGKARNESGSAIDGSEVNVTVTMKKENGMWRFDGDSKRAGGKATPVAAKSSR